MSLMHRTTWDMTTRWAALDRPPHPRFAAYAAGFAALIGFCVAWHATGGGSPILSASLGWAAAWLLPLAAAEEINRYAVAGLDMRRRLLQCLGLGTMGALVSASFTIANEMVHFGGAHGLLLREWVERVPAYAFILIAAEFARGRARPAPEEPTQLPIPAPKIIDTTLLLPDGQIICDAGKIVRVTASGNYAEVETANRTLLVRSTLGAMEAMLKDRSFVRISRGQLVNWNAIEHIGRVGRKTAVRLRDGRTLIAGPSYRDRLVPPK